MAKQRGGLFGLFRSQKPDPAQQQARKVTTPAQKEMRLRIAEFETARVNDVMLPRAEIVAVELSTRLPDLLAIFAQESHSRLPIYRDTLDDPIGFVHIKDVVAELAKLDQPAEEFRSAEYDKDRPLERLRRNVLFVPASMRLTDLLVKMQASRIHLALVIDEYGGTDGLLSLEDLVEEIVGDIEDEHDENVARLIRRGRLSWQTDARLEIEDFLAETGIDLSLKDHEVDTLGGVAFALAGRVPLRGEVLRHPLGVDIEIIDADARRVSRLIIRKSASETQI